MWQENHKTSKACFVTVGQAKNSASFWILHVLSAYNPVKVEAFDDTPPQPLFEFGYAKPLALLLYHESLRDVIHTGFFQNGNPMPWIAIDTARSRLMLHETMHYFLGSHDNNGDTDHLADIGIMNKNWNAPDTGCYLYTSGTDILTPKQIKKTRSCPKPT